MQFESANAEVSREEIDTTKEEFCVILIEVTQDSEIFVRDEKVELDDVQDTIKGIEDFQACKLILKAHKETEAGLLVGVMNAISTLNGDKMSVGISLE